MSFTTTDIVRRHLLHSQTPQLEILNRRILLESTNVYALPHSNLVEDSEVVKLAVIGRVIDSGPHEALHNKAFDLEYSNFVRGSVVVTLTDDLSVHYDEEYDFRVDHELGSITPLSDGSIPQGTPVKVFYQYYDDFREGVDYEIDYVSGRIWRRSGSSIPSGATVLIDYLVSAGSIEDVLIDQAIDEAEDLILRCLTEGYDDTSDDQGLTTGATQLALSIVARGMAADVLLIHAESDANSRSKEWQNLSVLWEAAAWKTLAPFLNPNTLNSTVVQ